MKTSTFSIYKVIDPINLQLQLLDTGFSKKEDAEKQLQEYPKGLYTILEVFE